VKRKFMKRILVVDDNRLERKLIVHTITALLGENVLIDDVAEGATALNYISNQKYHLIITDLIMPRVEGLDLISIIRRNHGDCKILAVSGSKPYYLHLARKLGVNGVFTKPIDKDKFSQTITTLLE
jgi:YesN/AraC family two-component response regulator